MNNYLFIYYKLEISSFGLSVFTQSILTVRKWPRFHWYETAGNRSNRRPRFEVPPVKRLTVTRGYGLGYPKRRPRGHSLGSPCVGWPGKPVSPSSPCWFPACSPVAVGELRVALRALRRAKYMGFFFSLHGSILFLFHRLLWNLLLFCGIWEKITHWNGIHKEFQFLDDELVFGHHQQTELLSLNSCYVVFLLHWTITLPRPITQFRFWVVFFWGVFFFLVSGGVSCPNCNFTSVQLAGLLSSLLCCCCC
jgi:hypothetical protein